MSYAPSRLEEGIHTGRGKAPGHSPDSCSSRRVFSCSSHHPQAAPDHAALGVAELASQVLAGGDDSLSGQETPGATLIAHPGPDPVAMLAQHMPQNGVKGIEVQSGVLHSSERPLPQRGGAQSGTVFAAEIHAVSRRRRGARFPECRRPATSPPGTAPASAPRRCNPRPRASSPIRKNPGKIPGLGFRRWGRGLPFTIKLIMSLAASGQVVRPAPGLAPLSNSAPCLCHDSARANRICSAAVRGSSADRMLRITATPEAPGSDHCVNVVRRDSADSDQGQTAPGRDIPHQRRASRFLTGMRVRSKHRSHHQGSPPRLPPPALPLPRNVRSGRPATSAPAIA